jgi:hypothetical protein
LANGGEITKHSKAVAALVPIEDFSASGKQSALLKLKGSGRGLWGADAGRTIDALRDEWRP